MGDAVIVKYNYFCIKKILCSEKSKRQKKKNFMIFRKKIRKSMKIFSFQQIISVEGQLLIIFLVMLGQTMTELSIKCGLMC